MDIKTWSPDELDKEIKSLDSDKNIVSLSDKIKDIIKQLLDLVSYDEFSDIQNYINKFSSQEEVLSFLEKINAWYKVSDQSIWEHLRERQKESILKQIDFYTNSNAKSWLVTFATWWWKTVMFIDLARMLLNTGKKVLILTPSKISLNRAWDESDKISMDYWLYFQNEKNLSQDLIIWTWQSILPLIKSWEIDKNEFNLIICDEVHAMLWDEVSKIYSYFDSKIIWYTATPELLKKWVMDFLEENIDTYLVDEAIYDWVLPRINSSLTIKLQSNIFNSLELNSDGTDFTEVSKLKIPIKEVFEDVFNLIDNELSWKKWIVFFPIIDNSLDFEEFIIWKWLNAKHMDWDTPEEERKEIFRQFENWIIDVLCCSDLLRYSYDSDIISYAIILDFTMSPAKYMQMVWRPLHWKELDSNWNIIWPKREIYVVDMVNNTEDIKNRPITARSLNNVTTTWWNKNDNKNYNFEVLTLAKNIPITETLLYFDMKETLDDSNLIDVYMEFKETLWIDTLWLLELSLDEIESRLTEEQKNVYIFIDLIPNSHFSSTVNIKSTKLKLNFFDFVRLINAYKKNYRITKELEKYWKNKDEYMENTIQDFLNWNIPIMYKPQITYFLNNLSKFELNESIFNKVYNSILESNTKSYILEKIEKLVSNINSFWNFYFNIKLFERFISNCKINKSLNYKSMLKFEIFSEGKSKWVTFNEYIDLCKNKLENILENLDILEEKDEETFFKIYNMILTKTNFKSVITDLHKLLKFKNTFNVIFDEIFLISVTSLINHYNIPGWYRALLEYKNFSSSELNHAYFVYNLSSFVVPSEYITKIITMLNIILSEEEVKLIIDMEWISYKDIELLLDNSSIFPINNNIQYIYNIIIQNKKFLYLLYKYNDYFLEYTKDLDKVDLWFNLIKSGNKSLLQYLTAKELNEIMIRLIESNYKFNKTSGLYSIFEKKKKSYFKKLLEDKKYLVLENNFSNEYIIETLKNLLLESNYKIIKENLEFFKWEENKIKIFHQIKSELFKDSYMLRKFFENEKKYNFFNLSKNDVLSIINDYFELFDFSNPWFFVEHKKELYWYDEDVQLRVLLLIKEKLNIESIFYYYKVFSTNVLKNISQDISNIFLKYNTNEETIYDVLKNYNTKSLLKLISISWGVSLNIFKSIYKKIMYEKKDVLINCLELFKNLDKFNIEEDFDLDILKGIWINWAIEYYYNTKDNPFKYDLEKYKELIKQTFVIDEDFFDTKLKEISEEWDFVGKMYHLKKLTNIMLKLKYLIKDKHKMLVNIIKIGDLQAYNTFKESFNLLSIESNDEIYISIVKNFKFLLFDWYISVNWINYDKNLFLDLINYEVNNDFISLLKQNILLFKWLDIECFKKVLEKNQNETDFLIENKNIFWITQEIDFLKDLNLKYKLFSLDNLSLFISDKRTLFLNLLEIQNLDFIKNSTYFDDFKLDPDLVNRIKNLWKEWIDYLTNKWISVDYSTQDLDQIINFSKTDKNMFIWLLNKIINNEQLLFSIFEYFIKNKDLWIILNHKNLNDINEIREKLESFLWDNLENIELDLKYIKDILIKRFGVSEDDF